MMQVSLVPYEFIDNVWPDIETYMQGAADYTYGRYDVSDIRNNLEKGQQLWVAFDEERYYGAVVTEVIEYPRMKTLMLHFTGGVGLKEWKSPMLHLLQQYAKENGCAKLESYGRLGWAKIFESDGYKPAFVFYELPIEA